MSASDKYQALYQIHLNLSIPEISLPISDSDVVSVSFIHNYDTMTYPIIRVRLYSDISVIQTITEYPNDIYVNGTLSGGIYRLNDEVKSPVLVKPIDSINISLKGYIENKNIPTSIYDQYDLGIKKSSDLNSNVKVPIEIFCYDDSMIHLMRQKVPSIYRDISLTTTIEDMLTRNGIYKYNIDPLNNQTKYSQILIPNLNILESLSFFDNQYGLYRKGTQVYGYNSILNICNADVINGTKPIPIHVENSKGNNELCGMKHVGDLFQMVTLAGNVSVLTETDIERVMNGRYLADVNVSNNSMQANVEELSELFDESYDFERLKNITTPDIIHKSKNEYVSSAYVARLNENITSVDLSGSGFDISLISTRSRFNLIFSTPIRGLDINKVYRPSYACHVLSNLDSNLFIPQTTMHLCTN